MNRKYTLFVVGLMISSALCAMQQNFLTITYTKQPYPSTNPNFSTPYIFQTSFNWKNNIRLQYESKRYYISHGIINFDTKSNTGNLDLYYRTFNLLNSQLNLDDFTTFTENFDKAVQDTLGSLVITKQVSAYDMNNPTYKAIENLIYKKFPGSKISYSWTDWAKSYWKPVLGSLGLAGAGYAGYLYYKYYHK